jgi:hypothetical protein
MFHPKSELHHAADMGTVSAGFSGPSDDEKPDSNASDGFGGAPAVYKP